MEESKGASPGTSRKRVLVVDDEQYTCQLFEHLLDKEGYRVEVCYSGEKAMELIDGNSFDLVLVDIRLPRMDGFEVIRRIRSLRPPPAVIAITAYGSIDMAVRAMKEGAGDFLTKPFENLDMILQTIRRVLLDDAGFEPGVASGGQPVDEFAGLRRKVNAIFDETTLSKREKETVFHLIRGMSNREIGAALQISERTVKNHLFNIYRKLGISNRNQLFNIFIEKSRSV